MVHPSAGRLRGTPSRNVLLTLKEPVPVYFKVDYMWELVRFKERSRFYKNKKSGYTPDQDCVDCCPDFAKRVYIYGMKCSKGVLIMCSERACQANGSPCRHIRKLNQTETVEDFPSRMLRAVHDGSLDTHLYAGGPNATAPTRTMVLLRVDVNKYGAHPDPTAQPMGAQENYAAAASVFAASGGAVNSAPGAASLRSGASKQDFLHDVQHFVNTSGNAEIDMLWATMNRLVPQATGAFSSGNTVSRSGAKGSTRHIARYDRKSHAQRQRSQRSKQGKGKGTQHGGTWCRAVHVDCNA